MYFKPFVAAAMSKDVQIVWLTKNVMQNVTRWDVVTAVYTVTTQSPNWYDSHYIYAC